MITNIQYFQVSFNLRHKIPSNWVLPTFLLSDMYIKGYKQPKMFIMVDIGLESPFSIQYLSFPLIFRKVLRTSILGLGKQQIKSLVLCRQYIFLCKILLTDISENEYSHTFIVAYYFTGFQTYMYIPLDCQIYEKQPKMHYF